MPFYTYMLKCANGAFYVGYTDNVEQRMVQHRVGTYAGYTSIRLPVELVWTKRFDTLKEAVDSEQKLKGWSRKKKELLIANDWEAISNYCKNSRCLNEKAPTT